MIYDIFDETPGVITWACRELTGSTWHFLT